MQRRRIGSYTGSQYSPFPVRSGLGDGSGSGYSHISLGRGTRGVVQLDVEDGAQRSSSRALPIDTASAMTQSPHRFVPHGEAFGVSVHELDPGDASYHWTGMMKFPVATIRFSVMTSGNLWSSKTHQTVIMGPASTIFCRGWRRLDVSRVWEGKLTR